MDWYLPVLLLHRIKLTLQARGGIPAVFLLAVLTVFWSGDQRSTAQGQTY